MKLPKIPGNDRTMITCAFSPSDPASSAHFTAQFELPHAPKSGAVANKIPTNVTVNMTGRKISPVLFSGLVLVFSRVPVELRLVR